MATITCKRYYWSPDRTKIISSELIAKFPAGNSGVDAEIKDLKQRKFEYKHGNYRGKIFSKFSGTVEYFVFINFME